MQQFIYSQIDNYKEYKPSGRGFVFTSVEGFNIKFTPYGNNIIRVQVLQKGEEVFPDNYYEMVETHNWNGKLNITEKSDSFIISSAGEYTIVLHKNPMRFDLIDKGRVLFSESKGVEWKGNEIFESFTPNNEEHFTGLGHGFFGH